MALRAALAAAVLLLVAVVGAYAADPELTIDFFVPQGVNASSLDGNFFTNTDLSYVQPMKSPFATVMPVNSGKFQALTGLSISYALLQFPPKTINRPHIHPRGTEAFYLMEGSVCVGLIDSNNKLFTQLQFPPKTINRPHIHPRGTEAFYLMEGSVCVGLLDSNNKLFTQTLQKGDIFVFPRSLVHFQINVDPKVTAMALGAFSSSAPGTIILPPNLFGSKGPLDDNVFAQSFQVSVDIIKKLKIAQQM